MRGDYIENNLEEKLNLDTISKNIGYSKFYSVSAGFVIYDTMQYIKCDVSTICIGLAASFGAFLLAGGTKGKRFALPNAEIMIHQPAVHGNGIHESFCQVSF